MNTIIKSFLAFATAFAFFQITAFSQAAPSSALWTAGHGDIGIGYEEGALEPHWHLGEDNEAVTLDGVTAPLGPEGGEYAPAAITPVTSLFQQVGISGPSYYVFPEFEDPTVPYVGFGTEELTGPSEGSPGDWDGFLTLSLTGASGPGDFYLFIINPGDGSATTLMNSSDGFSSSDSINLAPADHTHRTIAFTQQGDYDLTFEIAGTHFTDGAKTATVTYGFSVVPEPSTAGLLFGAAALILTVVRRRVS